MDEKPFLGDTIVGLEGLVNKNVQQQPAPPLSFGGKRGEPVPEVDPDDLKALWCARHERQAQAPHAGEHAMSLDVAQQICKPGADVYAVFYRLGFLWLMTQFVPDQIAAFTKEGQPIDAAFRAAAKVPAEWMGVGIVREGPPFDVNEFVRLCSEVHTGDSQNG